MSVKYLSQVNENFNEKYNYIKKRGFAYEYDETLTYEDEELTSDPIIMPNDIIFASVTLGIGESSSGKIQTTTNKLADVISGTNVVWKDWDLGEVSSTSQDLFGPVTAIRFICSLGTVRLMLRAQ